MAWLNLLSYFQQLPSLGIFILMFRDVGFTMLKFLLIMFVFVIAFGLGFHILFKNNNVRNSCHHNLLNEIPFSAILCLPRRLSSQDLCDDGGRVRIRGTLSS